MSLDRQPNRVVEYFTIRSQMDVKIVEENGKQYLVIKIEMTKPTLSPTGKTRSVASSHGNQPTQAVVDGKVVIVGCNAYIKP